MIAPPESPPGQVKPPRAPGAAGPGVAQPSGPPAGIWDQVATLLASLAPEGATPKAAGGKVPPALASKSEGDPFSLLDWAEES
jgi:hypothetical protein